MQDSKHAHVITDDQLQEDEKRWIYGEDGGTGPGWMKIKGLFRLVGTCLVCIPLAITTLNSQLKRLAHSAAVPSGYEFIAESEESDFYYGKAEGADDNTKLLRIFSIDAKGEKSSFEASVGCPLQELDGVTQRNETVGLSLVEYACRG